MNELNLIIRFNWLSRDRSLAVFIGVYRLARELNLSSTERARLLIKSTRINQEKETIKKLKKLYSLKYLKKFAIQI